MVARPRRTAMPAGPVVLNVAEKPSVAKEASRALSRNQATYRRGAGGTACWDFSHTVQGTTCQMVFTSVAGHLMSTDFKEPFNKWKSCAPLELFHKPIKRYVPANKKVLEAAKSRLSAVMAARRRSTVAPT